MDDILLGLMSGLGLIFYNLHYCILYGSDFKKNLPYYGSLARSLMPIWACVILFIGGLGILGFTNRKRPCSRKTLLWPVVSEGLQLLKSGLRIGCEMVWRRSKNDSGLNDETPDPSINYWLTWLCVI